MNEMADFSWLRIFIAFFIVLGLMGGLAAGLKYISARGFSLTGKQNRRLKIVESLPLDPRRRFVIVRCDDREHLLLLSSQGDSVVETNLPPAKDQTNR